MTAEDYAKADLDTNFNFCRTVLEFIVVLFEEYLQSTLCGRLDFILFRLTSALFENLYWIEQSLNSMELAKLADHLKTVTLKLWNNANGVRVEGARATS